MKFKFPREIFNMALIDSQTHYFRVKRGAYLQIFPIKKQKFNPKIIFLRGSCESLIDILPRKFNKILKM